MEIKWKTYSHIYHPYGDLIWHLFWGIIIGGTLIWAILKGEYWLFIISIFSLIFFFHPEFYRPKILDIKLNEEGLYLNNKFYSWNKFYAFEIFDNGLRKFIFFFPKNISLGLHIPLEEFFISELEVKEFLSKFLEEKKGEVPIFDLLYRKFYL